MDYGTLMCWADNAVGQQKEPCVFHIIAAGKPDPPYNCTLVNQTSDGLEVDCNEGMYKKSNKIITRVRWFIHLAFPTRIKLYASSFLKVMRNYNIDDNKTVFPYTGNFEKQMSTI